MIEFAGSIDVARRVAEAATAMGGASDDAANRVHRAELAVMVRCLRTIYFTPRGTLNVLEKLAADLPPDADDVEKTLIDFNDAEWRVERALIRMQLRTTIPDAFHSECGEPCKKLHGVKLISDGLFNKS